MLDVEARGSGELTAWVDERRPLVVGGAFAAAVLLGVVIGLLTAPGGGTPTKVTSSPTPAATELTPPLPAVSWENSRQAGVAHQMFVTQEPDPVAFRLALSWSVAEQMQAESGAQTPLPADVTIPEGMYYGAIEGTDSSSDVFWAVGETEVANTAAQPGDPYVWNRVGTGPWQVVESGPGSCARLPNPLFAVWKGRPAMCDAS